jgi:diguanylate cyclase (GGDEF)-like protein/PAS domain S-box-containing protein
MKLGPGFISRALARLQLLILLPALAVLLLALVWTVIYVRLVDERAAAIDDATSMAESLSRDYADRTARVMRQVDQATRFLKFALEQQGAQFRFDDFVRNKGMLPADLLAHVTLFNSRGDGVASNRAGAMTNVADRDYFAAHVDVDTGEFHISSPVMEPGASEWSIIVSRRLNHPDGSFAGVVACALQQDFLTNFSPIALYPGGFVGLLGADGRFRASRIGARLFSGDDKHFSGWIKPVAANRSVAFIRDNPFDHISRIFSYQQLDEFPLMAVVGIEKQRALQSFDRHRIVYLWTGAAGSLGILAFIGLLLVQGTRLRKSELATVRAQAVFRAAAEGSPDAISILRAVRGANGQIDDFIITEINERGARLIGRAKDDILGLTLSVTVPGAHVNGRFAKYLQAMADGKPLELEFPADTPIGKLWLRHQVVPIKDGLAITTRDITARKLAEQETRNSRAFLQSLIDNLPLAVYARDMRGMDGKMIVWNQTAELVTGIAASAVLNQPGASTLPGWINDTLNELETRMKDDPMVIDVPQVPFRSIDGRDHFLRVISVPLLSEDGKLDYILGIAEDITINRQQELALRSKQAELVAANDASPLGLFRTDPKGNCTYVNRTYEEMAGISSTEALGDGWVKAIHPEDRLKVIKAWNRVPGVHTSFLGTYRFRHADGRLVWVSMKTAPIVVDGEVEGYVGSVDDITARREAEQALSKSEQRLRTITDTLPALVAFVDAEQRYRFNNLAYERAFGINRDDIKYQTIRQFVGEEQYAYIEPYLQRALNGETVTFEHEEGANGAQRWAEATYIPQLALEGKEVVGIHMMIHDITAKKREEQRLLQLVQIDSLTGLVNRTGFENRLALAMTHSRSDQNLMALMYLDIDHFKNVNDSHGHPVGDALLKGFAGRLSRAVRSTDIIARLGGDEFTVIMENISKRDDAEKIAAKIIAAMRPLFMLEGRPLSITASIGVAYFNGTSADAKSLIRQADEMLYQAKARGRDQYCLWPPTP